MKRIVFLIVIISVFVQGVCSANQLNDLIKQMDNPNKLIRDVQKQYGLDKNASNMYLKTAGYLIKKGHYTKAITICNQAIFTKPDYGKAYHMRAEAYYEMNQPAKAISDFTRAYELNPKLIDACFKLAWIYATCEDQSLRDGKKAVEFATTAVEAEGFSHQIHTLGAAYVADKQYDKAVETYTQVVKKDNSYLKVYQKSLKENGLYDGPIGKSLNTEFKKALHAFVEQGNHL